MAIDYYKLRLHFTHRWKIKKLYLEGYTDEELAIMYRVPIHVIKRHTRLLKKPERV